MAHVAEARQRSIIKKKDRNHRQMIFGFHKDILQ